MLDFPVGGAFRMDCKEIDMLKIGEFSKLCKSTVKTLRYYDEVGLLNPVFVDDNGYRYYEIEQLNTIIKIMELRGLDISINDIKEIIYNGKQFKVLNKQLRSLEGELIRKQNQISLIKNYIVKAEKGDFMENYEAKEIVVPKNVVYYRHGIIGSMAEMLNFIMEAQAECRANNPTLKCKNYCYVTYTAKEYKEFKVELEYVEAVEKMGQESECIKFRIDNEIKAISVKHKGDYAGLSKAYAFALNYVKEKGLQIVGAIREVYIDGCWNKDNV